MSRTFWPILRHSCITKISSWCDKESFLIYKRYDGDWHLGHISSIDLLSTKKNLISVRFNKLFPSFTQSLLPLSFPLRVRLRVRLKLTDFAFVRFHIFHIDMMRFYTSILNDRGHSKHIEKSTRVLHALDHLSWV